MSSWKHAWTLVFWLLIQVASLTSTTTAAYNNGNDFAFEASEEIQSRTINDACSIRRLWGVPDMPAYIGHIFKLQIPKEAFSGKILSYKFTGVDGTIPSWLIVDKHRGLLRGVPDAKDYGDHRLIVTAMPFSNYSIDCPLAKDIFTIEVTDKKEIPSLHSNVMEQCHTGQSETYLKIVIDRNIHQLTPKEKLAAINGLSNFMAVDANLISIVPYDPLDEKSERNEVLMSGPGDKLKKIHGSFTSIQFVVGCSGKLRLKQSILAHQIKKQAKDGTISFVIRLPIIGWKIITQKQPILIRNQRQVDGSGYDENDPNIDDEDYSGAYEDGDYDETIDGEEVDPDTPPRAQPTPPMLSTAPPETPHHHRHHHGETFLATTPDTTTQLITTEVQTVKSTTSSTTTPETTTTLTTQATYSPPPTSVFSDHEISLPSMITTLENTSQMETETSTLLYSPRNSSDTSRPTVAHVSPTVEITSIEPSITHPATLPTEDTASSTFATSINDHVTQANPDAKYPDSASKNSKEDEENESEIDIIPEVIPTTENVTPSTHKIEISLPTDDTVEDTLNFVNETSHRLHIPHLHSSPTNISFSENTEHILDESPSTTVAIDTTTERSSTIIGKTTETVDFTIPVNRPPYITHRLVKLPVTAGKAFSYIVPENLFYDPEDKTNLQFSMYDEKYNPLKSGSWIQFNPETREVYGLPLEDDVSKWEFVIEATDTKGASINDTLDVTVQQHKARRTINHEFSMKLRIANKYTAVVDWQIRALKGLVNLFRDTDMDQITVINVDLQSDPVEFVWTNDTLPRSYCPKNDIDRLMGVLQESPEGDPSALLSSVMAPELLIKSVSWKGTGICQGPPSTPIDKLIPNAGGNLSPMPRNQIDQVNATVGELLILPVPLDTFYDYEDGNVRNLKVWLTREDRSPIPANNWLQFDMKNQEFYGIPMERDVESKKYQLVCENRHGLTASDALIVDVHTGPPTNWTLEFKMTITTPYDLFINNALVKRKFVEKLHKLFDDDSLKSIKIKSITNLQGVVVSWYNLTLPTDKCPHSEIDQLKKVLIDDKSLTERVHSIMGTEFPVMSVSFITKGLCSKGDISYVGPDITSVQETPGTHGSGGHGPHATNEDPSKTAKSDDYIITFIIPIAVIACMIIIAALIACILYKRRHSGKMSVGDEEERQAFRSKGIPVIFQDELDEKPDATNKTPIIMKEEKPPLFAPPEYKAGDSSSPTPSHTPYHPPPPFTASRDNVRNSRPKPTPTYRKPPPYVPP